MANDRLFLLCNECHASWLFYKFYPGGGYARADGLGEYIFAHLHGDQFAGFLASEHFTVENECQWYARMDDETLRGGGHPTVGWPPEKGWDRTKYDAFDRRNTCTLL